MTKFVFRLFGFLLLLSVQVTGASAHATPVEYEPAGATLLTTAPATVRIRFSERIEPGASGITVFAPDGTDAGAGSATVDPENPRVFSVPVRAAGSGTYAVSWQVVSADDGHFTKGAFAFSVGSVSAADAAEGGARFQVQHRSGWPEAITIASELLGHAILLAIVLMITYVWRLLKRDESTDALRRRLTGLTRAAGVLILTGCGAYLLLKSSHLAQDRSVPWAGAFASFLTTTAGRYALYRMTIGLAVATALSARLPRMLAATASAKSEHFLLALLVLIAFMRAQVSHAAASHFLPLLSVIVNMVHLLAKDFWIGGVIVLSVAFLPAFRNHGRFLVDAQLRFSRLAMIAFGIGGVTGSYIVWLHLKSPANLLSTHWGGYVLALGAYGVLLLVIRLYQQLAVHPALARLARGVRDKETTATARGAEFFMCAEALTGIAVIVFSGILIITTPPLSAQMVFEKTVRTPEAAVTFGEHRFEDRNFLISVARGDGANASGAVLTVTLENQEKGIGPLVVSAEERFPGGYAVPKDAFSPPGGWTVRVTERSARGYDAVAAFTFRYPDDLEAVHADGISWPFTIISLLTALGIGAASWIFYRHARRIEARMPAGSRESMPAFPITLWQRGAAGAAVCTLLVFLGMSLGSHHGSGGFRAACADAGGYWHENVPMHDGRATSGMSVLGCMLGAGKAQHHFADAREFAWFRRPAFAVATLTTDPPSPRPGEPVTLFFTIKDPAGAPVRDLVADHDRILHAVTVSQDRASFAHLHVEDGGPVSQTMLDEAVFPVRYTFPAPSRYLIGLDFTVRSRTFSQELYVTVPGIVPSAANPAGDTLTSAADGMDATLTLPAAGLTAGQVQKVTIRFSENGTPVTDLEPYLSAAMHASVVSTDLRRFVHVHGELPQSFFDSVFAPRDPSLTHVHQYLPDRFGPELVSYIRFPAPGVYEIFGEVKRAGKVVVIRFVVTVK